MLLLYPEVMIHPGFIAGVQILLKPRNLYCQYKAIQHIHVCAIYLSSE